MIQNRFKLHIAQDIPEDPGVVAPKIPASVLPSEDDRFALKGFFLAQGAQDERVTAIAAHFYIGRDSVYRRKNRTPGRLANALYGRF